MHLADHPLTSLNPKEISVMQNILRDIQRKIWMTVVNVPNNFELITSLASTIAASDLAGEFLFIKTSNKWTSDDKDPFHLWSIFNLLLVLLISLDPVMFTTEPEQKPSVQDSLLTALSTSLVPYTSLVTIVCGGDRRRNCDICRQETTVNIVVGMRAAAEDIYNQSFISFPLPVASCHRKSCSDAGLKKFKEAYVADCKEKGARITFRCDYCFCRRVSVHRCEACRTKLYCSQACLLKDWKEVHKRICMEGGEQRKVKKGARDRRRREQESSEIFQGHMDLVQRTVKKGPNRNQNESA